MRVFLVSIVAPIMPLFIFLKEDQSLIRLIIVGATGLISTLITIYFIGLNTNERRYFITKINYRTIKKITPDNTTT